MAWYSSGVLFVHGIGEQKRADTLLQCADPMIRWLQRWIRRTQPGTNHRIGDIQVNYARVSDEAGAPAHAVLDITLNDADGQPHSCQRWLLAEARWAEEVQTPTFGKLAVWMLTTGSWIILSHFLTAALRIERKPRRFHWFLKAYRTSQAVVRVVVTTAVMQIVLSIALLLAALPIPKLRAALSDVLLRTSGILGDIYVLLESSIQREAIVGSVRRSLDWVARQCGTTAVVAHSQGAAVSHRVLRSPQPSRVSAFITYGSGLAKLEELQVMYEAYEDMLQYAKYAIPLAIGAGAFAYRVVTLYSESAWALRALWWCIFPGSMLLILFGFAFGAPKKLKARNLELSLAQQRPKTSWLDLYATADPVSNGRLVFGRMSVKGVRSRPVTNRRSVFTDHTTYWENETEFIPTVLQRLDRDFRSLLFDNRARQLLRKVARERRARFRWLSVIRSTSILAAALIVVGTFGSLEAIGRVVLAAVQVPPITPIGLFVAGAGRIPLRILEFAAGAAVGAFTGLGYGVAAVLLISLATIVAYRAFFIAWRWWEQLHVQSIFTPSEHSVVSVASGSAVIAFGLLPFLSGLALAARPQIESGLGYKVHVSEQSVYQLLGIAFAAMYSFVGAVVVKTTISEAWSGKDRMANIGAAAMMMTICSWIIGVLSIRTLAIGFTVFALGGLAVRCQLWFWEQGRAIGTLFGIFIVALAPVLSVLGFAAGLAAARRSEDFSDLVAAPLVLYMFSAGLAWVVLRAARWFKPAPSDAMPKPPTEPA